MVISLVGCGGSASSSTPASEPASTATSTSAPASGETTGSAARVGVFYYSFSDAFISSVRSALDEALTSAGIEYQNFDGNSSQATQNESITTAPVSYTHLDVYKRQGVYTVINFTSEPTFPAELDRVYKITDGVLRTIIVAKEEETAKTEAK